MYVCVCVGLIRFTQLVKLFEKQDAEVARLNAELRANVLLQMTPSEEPSDREQTQQQQQQAV